MVEVSNVRAPVTGATLRVRLLDVTVADAPSITVSEIAIDDVSLPAGGRHEIPFSLETGPLAPRQTYTLAAHVDLNGSGVVEEGDYISTTSTPPAPAAGGQVHIRVQPVG